MAKQWLFAMICFFSLSAEAAPGLLRMAEIERLSSSHTFEYFQALQKHLTTIEKIYPLNLQASRATPLWDWVVAEAYAAPPAPGNSCFIGGYESKWYRKDNGRLSCGFPDQKPGVRSAYLCGTNPERGYCNENVYLYASGTTRHCVALDPSFGANCEKAFLTTYQPIESKADQLEAALRTLKPKADSYDDFVMKLEVYKTKLEADGKISMTAGQRQAYQSTQRPLAKIIAQLRALQNQQVQNRSAGAKPDVQARTGSVLGEELGCVMKGLKNLGHNPSDRFLALVGVSVQHYLGPFDTSKRTGLRQFQEAVIERLRMYGYCSTNAYPNIDPQESAQFDQVRLWLTGGKDVREPKRLIDDAKISADGQVMFEEIFGFKGRSNRNNLFGIDQSKWNKMSWGQRQRDWAITDSEDHSPKWNACRKEAKARIMNTYTFNLQALPGGATYFDPKKKKAQLSHSDYEGSLEDSLATIKQVGEDNTALCQAMANSCGLQAMGCSMNDGETPVPSGTTSPVMKVDTQPLGAPSPAAR